MRPILFAAIAGFANIAGGFLVTFAVRRRDTLDMLVAFGAGFMLAVALLEMLPAALDAGGGVTGVLVGYMAVHLTQHVLTPHFHFGEETHKEAMVSAHVGIWAFIGLLPHAFFDGVAIAAGYLEAPSLGFLIFVAVLLHKVPTGLSLASIMVASGNTMRRAMLTVTVVGAAIVAGSAVTPAVAALERYGLSLAAGVTIYVAASNLIPESQKQHGWWIPSGVFLGVISFYLARLVIPGV